jgi:hypothetical protein
MVLGTNRHAGGSAVIALSIVSDALLRDHGRNVFATSRQIDDVENPSPIGTRDEIPVNGAPSLKPAGMTGTSAAMEHRHGEDHVHRLTIVG